MIFFPEGKISKDEKNKAYLHSLDGLKNAMDKNIILEGTAVLCSLNHDLTVRLSDRIFGVIPREEGAIGIKEGKTRDIALLSRVNKPCSFVVIGFKDIDGIKTPLLSRRKAQEMCMEGYIKNLKPGDVISCTVTHLEPFGAFVDIGCGISSLIPIDLISVSRIGHPSERFSIGQEIKAVVKNVSDGRVYLSHKELLGTWEENADLFKAGETVGGTVRSKENYGVFVELTPNLAGLAEICPEAEKGMECSVYIKSIIPEKMKVKLIIIESTIKKEGEKGINYFFTGNHMDRWQYSPSSSPKLIETVF